jgi:hypothetical protein
LAALFFSVVLPTAHAVVVTDNFSDGNDTVNPTWHHLDGAVGSTGQSWTVTNGAYRLIDPTTTTLGSQFPGLETYGFVGSYVDPSFTDVRLTTDVVDFVPGGEASSWFGAAVRLNGNNAQPNLQSGIQLHGYVYYYEGTARNGPEMVLGILHASGIKDISPGGSQKINLDPAKDYRLTFEAVGNVLHGQVFELGPAGQVVGLVHETMRDLDANPPDADNYDYDPNTPEAPFVPYASGFSGVFGVGSFLGSNADFTIDNFRTETVVGALTGDFDHNGVVNGADLAKWKGEFGQNAGSDADNDGDSDGADFLAWQQYLGAGGAAASVPEPGTIGLSVAAFVLSLGSRRLHRLI